MFSQRKSNIESKALRYLERVLLILGLVLSGIFVAAQVHRAVLLNAEMSAFRKLQTHQVLTTRSFPDFTAWSDNRISAYFDSLAEYVAPPVALLRIERVHLEVPVLDGTGELVLNRGVGHIPGTAEPGENGNVGIAGHRDGFFRALERVNLGDSIELEMMHENLRYRINGIQIVDPTDITVLRPKETPSLTLVTCYPFHFIGPAPRRFIVEASVAEATSDESSVPQSRTSKEKLASAPREAGFPTPHANRQRR
jgi:sortase A